LNLFYAVLMFVSQATSESPKGLWTKEIQ